MELVKQFIGPAIFPPANREVEEMVFVKTNKAPSSVPATTDLTLKLFVYP